MPTYDPVEAMLDALAAYFTTALTTPSPAVVVRKGWPEDNKRSAPGTAPELSIVATGRPVIERCSPHQIDRAVGEDDVVTYTYRVGWLRAQVQLDLWAAYRAQREERGAQVEAALINGLPDHADLRITAANYHSRPLTAVLAARRLEDGADSAPRGLWRSSWDLRVVMDVVATGTVTEIAELVLRQTTIELDTITEPDLTVP